MKHIIIIPGGDNDDYTDQNDFSCWETKHVL